MQNFDVIDLKKWTTFRSWKMPRIPQFRTWSTFLLAQKCVCEVNRQNVNFTFSLSPQTTSQTLYKYWMGSSTKFLKKLSTYLHNCIWNIYANVKIITKMTRWTYNIDENHVIFLKSKPEKFPNATWTVTHIDQRALLQKVVYITVLKKNLTFL